MFDEVYLKVSLQYQGDKPGFIENSEKLTKLLLSIMINGGPKFLIKMIPVAKLDPKILYEVISIVNLNKKFKCAHNCSYMQQ